MNKSTSTKESFDRLERKATQLQVDDFILRSLLKKKRVDGEYALLMSEFKDYIQQDLLRYEIRQPFSIRLFIRCFGIYYAPGLKFTLIFRLCQYYRSKNKFIFYFFMTWLNRLKYKYGFDISYRTDIGKGLYIGHFGGIVIHGDAKIGENCNLSQGITIGVL